MTKFTFYIFFWVIRWNVSYLALVFHLDVMLCFINIHLKFNEEEENFWMNYIWNIFYDNSSVMLIAVNYPLL